MLSDNKNSAILPYSSPLSNILEEHMERSVISLFVFYSKILHPVILFGSVANKLEKRYSSLTRVQEAQIFYCQSTIIRYWWNFPVSCDGSSFHNACRCTVTAPKFVSNVLKDSMNSGKECMSDSVASKAEIVETSRASSIKPEINGNRGPVDGNTVNKTCEQYRY